jgi:3-oxoacyl-[acyl-carrier-protein] synthase-3
MALLRFNNVGISGMAAAVPSTIINNYEYTQYFPTEVVKEIVDKVGIKERRFADPSTCSSDLCFAAAEKLIADKQIDRQEIDLLVFVSQTPDYRMPATSVILQHRLGLGKHTIAFDVSMGCSGFIYGLSIVFSMMQASGLRKALLLDGETRSRIYSPKDRNTAFLFGDGGVAALIETDAKFGQSFFSLNSDGSLENLIKINAGGYRNPSSLETVVEKQIDTYGNIRSEEHGYMNGGEVFNFVLREIPSNITEILLASNNLKSDIDFFVFHQANDFMNSYLAKKLKLPVEKVPSTIAKFGNTSSVSIPITIVSELKEALKEPKKILLSGFGVGMTWASAVLDFQDCFISDIVEV